MNQTKNSQESRFKNAVRQILRCAMSVSTAIALTAAVDASAAEDFHTLSDGPGSANVHAAEPVQLDDHTPSMHSQGYPAYEPQDWSPTYGPDCGFGCPPTWRVKAEYLLWRREGESNISVSNGFRLNGFDWEEAGRLTMGRKYDCAVGWEVVYTGPFEWIQTGTVTAPGTLNTGIQSNGTVDLSAFNGANLHQQTYHSQLQMLEASQKWWGWDVITTSAGLRMVDVDENFFFGSIDANGDIGRFNIRSRNLLIGPQLGIEMLFPIGNLSFDTSLKGALMANAGEATTTLTNAGVTQINNSVDDIEFAALVEGGYFLRYAVTPRIIARVGYEYLWIYGLGIAPEQFRNPATPTSGRGFDGQGDTFYHGAAGGIEIIF